jgi:conjugal transfer/type IV secretion protein DotA/TraY
MRLAGITLTPRAVLAYALLPRILPRLAGLNIRFAFVAYLMANLYGSVGLLPRGHPFLNAHQIGTYSTRQVFFEAARQLRFSWQHLDQLIMFFVLLAAFVLLVVQFALMLGFLLIGVAQATGATPSFDSVFITKNPTNDIAMMLLDRVFGVPGYFNSCISTPQPCEPTSTYLTPAEPGRFPEPHHIALQSLFGYFSTGVLLVGGMIVTYFIGAVILESMQTGVPMGKRFASVYAPIRLCLAVLMLVPLPTPGVQGSGAGYNAAQYLTLWLAGVGSSFGTNAWIIFNNSFTLGGNAAASGARPDYTPIMASPPTTAGAQPKSTLIAKPTPPNIDSLLQFMLIARSCVEMHRLNPTTQYYLTNGDGEVQNDPRTNLPWRQDVEPYIVNARGSSTRLQQSTTYQDALNFADRGSIRIRFGVQRFGVGIHQVCGELSLRTAHFRIVGAQIVTEEYFKMIKAMWFDPSIIAFSKRMPYAHLASLSAGNQSGCVYTNIPVPYPNEWGASADCGGGPGSALMPAKGYFRDIQERFQAVAFAAVTEARSRQIAAATAPVDNKILNRGWAGAGIWYNKLAEMNGGLFDAVRGLPDVVSMPAVMEKAASQRRAQYESVPQLQRFAPVGEGIVGPEMETAQALSNIYVYLQKDQFSSATISSRSGNVIFDLMNRLFGTAPLFDMRYETDVNPLIQIIGLGKSIIDAAFFNILAGGAIEITGGTLQNLDRYAGIGKALNIMGDAWFTVAMIGLGIGIILYYVVPFLPFIYFFFSVIKWLQSIFEAMIGMPMWALAHLRINGDGIPPDAAMSGYFLLLEIVLRPILTIFGMAASFVIFTAMVYFINDVFDLLTVNLTGYSPPSSGSMVQDLELKRGTVDQFFYTVMYVILVYMIAMMSFKLIDMIPANILRWAGSDAKNVVDEAGDPVPGMVKSLYVGSFGMPLIQQGGMIGQAVQGMRKAAEGTGEAIGKSLKDALKPSNKGVSSDE